MAACGGSGAGHDAGAAKDGGAAAADASSGGAPDAAVRTSDAAVDDAAADAGSQVVDAIHCPANGVLFEKLGLTHAPTMGDAYKRVTFKPPAGVYREVRLQVDVFAAKWNDPTTGTRYNMFWFARNGKNLDLFGYAALVAKHTVLLRHGIGIAAGNKPKITARAMLPMPATYHAVYRYNMAGGVAALDVSRGAAWTTVAQLRGVPNVTSISIGTNGTVDVDLGNQGPSDPYYNPAEPPQYGWRYSNLRVCLIPQ